MVLDINLFLKEKGGDPDLIKESQRRRFASVEIVDEIIALHATWKKYRYDLDQCNGKLNTLQKDMKEIYKDKEKSKEAKETESTALKKEKEALEQEVKKLKPLVDETWHELQTKLNQVGNIVHESVPVSNDEVNNATVQEWGEFKPAGGSNRHHDELLWMIDGYDPERGVKVAGHRGYFLKGAGVQLNLALISFGVNFLAKKGYTALQTPFFMNKNAMAATAQLSQFDEELYKVSETDSKGENKSEDKYLIATSEQPISAFHQGEWLDPKTLPLRYGGISTCFRKEAGAYGKDTWGIFRVHQFEKVEQFCITTPEKSWEEHEAMLKVSEEFYQQLGIPYHVVTIVSGELNNAAAKKYDLEGWFPAFNEFRELVSCSNCTDYQARSLEVRCGQVVQGQTEKKYVHMLNSTLCATTRTICSILENYQCDEGIRVPDVLKPYMGVDLIPFVKPPPARGRRTEEDEKQQQAAKQEPKKQAEKKPTKGDK